MATRKRKKPAPVQESKPTPVPKPQQQPATDSLRGEAICGQSGDPGDPPIDRVPVEGPHSESPTNTTLEDKNAVHGDPGDPVF